MSPKILNSTGSSWHQSAGCSLSSTLVMPPDTFVTCMAGSDTLHFYLKARPRLIMSSTAARSLGISLRRLWRLHQGHACMLPAARQLWLQTQPWQSLQPDCVKASAGLAVRSFSAQPGSDADTTPTRNMQLRLMHVVAIGMLIVAAARIIPIVCESCSALSSGRWPCPAGVTPHPCFLCIGRVQSNPSGPAVVGSRRAHHAGGQLQLQ